MIALSLLPEFDREMASTRKTLERVPDDEHAFKPHPKSMSMGDLALHLAEIPGWGAETLRKETADVSTYRPTPLKTQAELLAHFDKNVAAMRDALAKTTDEQFMKTWSLTSGEHTIFSMPRAAVIRGMILNHGIHHRAQLGVYLRLNDIPVPAIYGPSADEQQ
jgi:uncharacterized damage-inducible protein DinB